MKPRLITLSVAIVCLWLSAALQAAELVKLNEQNWDATVPAGKEVDAIYGDRALVSDRVVAIVADAKKSRNANLTIRGVAGTVIDFTERGDQNDQLSCFYPHAGSYDITGPVEWPADLPATEGSAKVAYQLTPPEDATATMSPCTLVVGYELEEGKNYLTIRSLITNPTDETVSFQLADGIRADGDFKFGVHQPLNVWWCQDEYWQQAYGVIPVDSVWKMADKKTTKRKPRLIQYRSDSNKAMEIAAGKSVVLERRLYAAPDTMALLAKIAADQGQPTATVTVKVTDPDGPVAGATVKAIVDSKVVATAKTDDTGSLVAKVPVGSYRWVIESLGRKQQDLNTDLEADGEVTIESKLSQLGHVAGSVTDGEGQAIPCRVALYGLNVEDPNFGPDSAVHGVRNLWHTADGTFDVAVLPGEYRLVLSYGPEYDAVIKNIEVAAGEATEVAEQLVHSVDTTGWLSSELHSHSSPSGDNTASQRGRVLNLLVDQLEFIPCTEHQRVSTYVAHLEHFNAMQRVLTCSGIEMTGSPLPINHQNAFPLVERPRTQNGGGPTRHVNPEVQIERLAMWDSQSDKVVQINHPNIGQMVGDKNLDGTPDEGFRKMFGFADVIEVHPMGAIFEPLTVGDDGKAGRGNTVKNWLQLMNLGYRIPGVVNTDAHYNYYGSGWRRNYVRSTTDNPAEADLMEVCHALEKGQVVMTNGPFMEVTATSGDSTVGPGEDLLASDGEPVLHIKVQCANWLDVNRIQIVVNGQLVPEFNFTRADNAEGFGNETVKYESDLKLPLSEDAHVVVVAAAEGRQLGWVYGPKQGKTMPIAISNPIFVDIEGDGFKPNGDTLGIALPVEADHQPTHGHDHPHPHH
ncbi:CehA/McbA family metallohydrolase [Aeoliella mucimassa]|uniref:Carboxypeptidase regulatory-like domain-containing protein n=1 Tax=Aeoliella mucimassa TaxID=2527972 RepID=A0A518AK53_9BACT|nr:CehA/McbA family metallohydrolase [Aeoliella mucimassa]QDU55109.1 hypothetical protein Pan181_12950 [Aeoliella mucimassa]